MFSRMFLWAALVALAHIGPSLARDPTPNIQTSNLPQGICPKAGSYLVPDIKDSTSYYVCCGDKETTVRRTCMYEAIGGGQYDVLAAASYQSAKGSCGSTPTPMTAGSFRSPEASDQPNWLDKLAYSLTPAVFNKEAAATCRSAAAPPPPPEPALMNITGMARQGPLQQFGQWQLIKNTKGVSSTGVVAINAVLLPESDKVLMWARVHMDGSKNNYEPGVIGADGVPEVSAVYNTNKGTYVVKKVRSTPFCTGQTILPSGQVLVTGGDDFIGFPGEKPGYQPSLKGIRLFNRPASGDWNKGTWTTLQAQLGSPRWYPTQALMPDGNRVVIIGGRVAQNISRDTITAEVYDHSQLESVSEHQLDFLYSVRNGRAIFPVMYVLPFEPTVKGDVQMFMFSCDKAAIEALQANNTWGKSKPIGGWPSPGYCGALSMSGTATMLMLEPETGYSPEVVMFGGHQNNKRQCRCEYPTSEWAHRIKLDKKAVDSSNFAWSREQMPHGRNLNDCVLLPNGKIVVVNGAKWGVVDNLRNAAYDAWMYDPKAPAGKRFTTLAPATVKRYYHSTALLLPDGSILTAGNEYGECTAACARKTPYLFHHQAERFLPPYFFTGGRPEITSLSAKELKYGGTVTLGYKGTVTGAVIMTPGAVTHQVNMNQRGVKLAVVSNAADKITVRMPPNNYITQPGYHMIFLMNGDKPCKKASWVRINL